MRTPLSKQTPILDTAVNQNNTLLSDTERK